MSDELPKLEDWGLTVDPAFQREPDGTLKLVELSIVPLVEEWRDVANRLEWHVAHKMIMRMPRGMFESAVNQVLEVAKRKGFTEIRVSTDLVKDEIVYTFIRGGQ